MTEQVTRIMAKARGFEIAMPCLVPNGKWEPVAWMLLIISDHEAYWIHTKTDTVVASSRNY